MTIRSGILLALLLSVGVAFQAVAGNGVILGLSDEVDELELYETPEAEDPAAVLARDALSFPAEILGVSDNGMYKLNHNGANYWVITDDVRSDQARAIDTGCEPQVAGDLVTHGKRGVGEGCE
jgi:hypothetical protein